MELPQKLPSRAKKCFQSNVFFQPGDPYVSQMILEKETWERRDYTPEAWQTIQDKGEFWYGSIPPKEEKKRDRSPLGLFIKRHVENPMSPIVFLLALYLERQKVLIYRPGLAKAPSRCYEEPSTGDLFCVTPQALSREEEKRVLNEIEEVLQSATPGV
jgi:hypothetical protein